MAGIGVITNPRARKNRKNPRLARRLAYILGERGHLQEPSDMDALDQSARHFRDHAIDVLCVNGGDGTLNNALSALVRAYGDTPLPKVALLRGGTMNTIAHSLGIFGKPADILDSIVTRYHGDEPLAQVSRHALQVDDMRCGFLFGTGIMSTFLEEYYKRDPTPARAGWVLLRAIGSALVWGAFAQRLFRPTPLEVEIDGERWPHDRWITVGAGTVDEIGLGFKPFYRAVRHPGQLHGLGMACGPVTLVRELPRIYRGVPTRSEDIVDAVCAEMVIRGEEPVAYMMDGDFFRGGREVRIRVGPRVDFVVPEP